MFNFDQFWKNHKFQRFANFRIKIEPYVDYSFGLILKKTFPSMIFREKKNQIYIIFTYKWLKLFKNPKFSRKIPEIAVSHTFGTEYARDLSCVKMCSFGYPAVFH